MFKNCIFLILLLFTFQMVFAQHNPGKDCMQCHSGFKLGGTVFLDSLGSTVAKSYSVSLIPASGSTITISSDSHGNFYSSSAASGSYIIKIGSRTSKTWHVLTTQKSCNTCHLAGGNGNSARTLELPSSHAQVPSDNSCSSSCHPSPNTRQYSQLKTHGVLLYSTSTSVNMINDNNSVIEFKLYPPYPNPFNSTVNLTYSIAQSGHLNIAIYNIAGQKVKTLVDSYTNETGQHTTKWEVNNLPSGIYFVSMKLGNTSTRKEILYLK
jgi:hypothetical protein